MNYYFHVLGKYAVFSGRASRKEFWLFWLVNLIISAALALFEGFNNLFPETNESVLTSVYALAVLLPTLAVGARRLHDTGRTGWWQLIALIPLVGQIVLIVFLVQDGQAGGNQYGPDPKGRNGGGSRSNRRTNSSEYSTQSSTEGLKWGDRTQIENNSVQTPSVQEQPTKRPPEYKTQAEERDEAKYLPVIPVLMNLNDDELYALAWKEVDGQGRAEGLWARLFVEHDGDETKTRVAYLKLRVEELHQLRRKEIEESEKKEQAWLETQKQQVEKVERQHQKEEDELLEKLRNMPAVNHERRVTDVLRLNDAVRLGDTKTILGYLSGGLDPATILGVTHKYRISNEVKSLLGVAARLWEKGLLTKNGVSATTK